MSTARHRGLTEPAADAAVDQACRMLRLPTIRTQLADRLRDVLAVLEGRNRPGRR